MVGQGAGHFAISLPCFPYLLLSRTHFNFAPSPDVNMPQKRNELTKIFLLVGATLASHGVFPYIIQPWGGGGVSSRQVQEAGHCGQPSQPKKALGTFSRTLLLSHQGHGVTSHA